MRPSPLDLKVLDAKINVDLPQPDRYYFMVKRARNCMRPLGFGSALEVLLSTQSICPPVLITVQKNETADELLLCCHRLGINFVRLGGVSRP
ncbi:helicase required for RNAi-mediated heterochromatin assembly 1 [Colletotrichum graminicola]|nr:helicase required for RNAi-mediated heterochromatin assembly 1 [Colletotrichum graminicola]